MSAGRRGLHEPPDDGRWSAPQGSRRAALSLGEARREGLVGVAGVFPPQLERAYGFRIGGLVSHGFLRDYAVTFDFERMVIVLDPAPAPLTPPST